MSFGDPEPYVGPLHDAGIAVAAQVNTAADVVRAVDAGVDVIVAQGTEAGGHTGRRATLPLLQEVLTLTDRPVRRGGWDRDRTRHGRRPRRGGRRRVDRHAAARPARKGSTHRPPRERVRAASGDDTVLTRAFDVAQRIAWPERWPGRALVNEFSRTWHGREDELARPRRLAKLVVEARRTDDPANAPLYAGESVGPGHRRERSATDVVRELDADAEKALRAASRLVG